MKVNQRCRMYDLFLTEARELRGKRSSYKCREFADDICTQSVQLTQAMT